jgi:hypothetical protein
MLILRSRSVRRVAETSRSRCRLGSRHSATAVFTITSTAGRARPGAPVVRAPLGIRPRCYHSHQRAIRYSHNLIEQRERLRGRHPVGPTPQRIRAHDLAVWNRSAADVELPKAAALAAGVGKPSIGSPHFPREKDKAACARCRWCCLPSRERASRGSQCSARLGTPPPAERHGNPDRRNEER